MRLTIQEVKISLWRSCPASRTDGGTFPLGSRGTLLDSDGGDGDEDGLSFNVTMGGGVPAG